MLSQLCGYLRNYFEREKVLGTFRISDGIITMVSTGTFTPMEGQYIRVIGSYLSDGVYKYSASGIEGLEDEQFEGAVWLLAIPKEVVALDSEIDAWVTKYSGAIESPFSSENLTASSYSYTKASSDSVGGVTWQKAFSARLAQWRKI